MKISSSYLHATAFNLKEQLLPALTPQTKKILIIAAVAISCIVALYLYCACCFRASTVMTDPKPPQNKDGLKDKTEKTVVEVTPEADLPRAPIPKAEILPQEHVKDQKDEPLLPMTDPSPKVEQLPIPLPKIYGLPSNSFQQNLPYQPVIPAAGNNSQVVHTGQIAYIGNFNGLPVKIAGDHLTGVNVYVNGNFVEQIDYAKFKQEGYHRNFGGNEIHIPSAAETDAKKAAKMDRKIHEKARKAADKAARAAQKIFNKNPRHLYINNR